MVKSNCDLWKIYQEGMGRMAESNELWELRKKGRVGKNKRSGQKCGEDQLAITQLLCMRSTFEGRQA